MTDFESKEPNITSDPSTQETVDSNSVEKSTPLDPTVTGSMPVFSRRVAAEVTFSNGQLISERFKIVRFIARGGMGEVYEAEDLELREHVALKTIRYELEQNQRYMERFRREIHVARKVTHPNVCRIFDVFHHRTDQSDTTFLTMELLRGESLADHIHKAGKMRTAEALPIIHQMADALGAAHKAGIIHRDFKSANVVLVPSKESEGGSRVVVTDFGLARAMQSNESLAVSLSGTGDVVGTPAYMAPEQVEGADVTAATDLYALGVVMYEMLTGTWPFVGDSPMSVAVKRLKEKAPSPRSHVPDLDPKWEAAILRCLERMPVDRFANAADVVKAISGEEVPASQRIQEARKKRKHQLLFASLLLMLIVIGAGYYVYTKAPERSAARATATPATPIKARKSVAVLGFKNLSGKTDSAWLSTALSEMLTTELAAGEKLRTISGENVARMKMDLSLPDAESFAKDTLSRIRTNIGSDYIIVGSYLVLGEKEDSKVRVDLRIQDATQGDVVASVSESGNQADLLELVTRTGVQLRDKLGAGQLTQMQQEAVNASKPSNIEAARLYAEGLAKLRVFDSLAAHGLLLKAVELDPNYPLAHSALSEAWSGLGYQQKAKDETKKAYELSANLSREERLLIEANYRSSDGEKEKAMKLYEILWGFFPDNIEYGLKLARAQFNNYKTSDALATIAQLRKLSPTASNDPRVDLTEAWLQPNLKSGLDAAKSALAKANQQGAQLVAAQARISQAEFLMDMNRQLEAKKIFQEAKELYIKVGNRNEEAATLMRIGASESDLSKRTKLFQEALAIFSEIGNADGVGWAQGGIAGVIWRQGDYAGTIKFYEKALASRRETGDKRAMANILYNMGSVMADQGERAGARAKFEEALSVYREVGDKAPIAQTQLALSLSDYNQGNLASSQKAAEEALLLFRELHEKMLETAALFVLGQTRMDQGNLLEAHRAMEEAVGNTKILDTQIEMGPFVYAVLLIEEGNAVEAERLMKEHARRMHDQKRDPNETLSLAIEARSLFERGEISDAQRVIAEAKMHPPTLQFVDTHLYVEIIESRILAASGKSSDVSRAIKILENTIADAKKRGYVGYQFEARLATGEIQLKFGRVDQGRATLQSLEKDATVKGYGLIARKASKIMAGSKSKA